MVQSLCAVILGSSVEIVGERIKPPNRNSSFRNSEQASSQKNLEFDLRKTYKRKIRNLRFCKIENEQKIAHFHRRNASCKHVEIANENLENQGKERRPFAGAKSAGKVRRTSLPATEGRECRFHEARLGRNCRSGIAAAFAAALAGRVGPVNAGLADYSAGAWLLLMALPS